MAWYKGQHTRHMSKNEVVVALEETQQEVATLTKELADARLELEHMRKQLQEEKEAIVSMSTSALNPILQAGINSTESYKSFLDLIKKDLESYIQTIVKIGIEKHADYYRHESISPYCDLI